MSAVPEFLSQPALFYLRVGSICSLGLLLTACERIAPTVERVTPPPQEKVLALPSPTAPVAKTWTDIPVVHPADRVTIHYHRLDNRSTGVVIWTWDQHSKQTPAENDLEVIGQDNFGLIFQFDRARYGGSDHIGLIPRVGHNWSQKDGVDKFWTPAQGNEIWLVQGKNDVSTRRPDLSPHIETAYIDGPSAVVVNLTNPVPLPVQVSILDQQNVAHAVQSVSPIGAATTASNKLNVRPADPLDLVNGHYCIQVEGFGPAAPLVPRGVLDNRAIFFDDQARLGATYTPQSTTFRLFAPTAVSVDLVLYDEFSGAKGRTVQALQPQPKGLWGATVNGDLQGKFYVYTLAGPALDPAHEALDPYATNAVASDTRGRITPTPSSASPGPRVASPTDMVIYEMHVRDFTTAPDSGVQNRGRYLGFTEPNTRLTGDAAIRTALDHLSELGVTHVELLPVQDYANDEAHPAFNWGYVPTAYFSPEGAYATNPNDASRMHELKALIDTLHARGIGVIMDVVYNHTAEDAPFECVVPGYYYRHLADGSLANGAACGNEFRTEAPMARKLILDSLRYWTKVYGVDGYRFDLMALIDRETMRQAERELRTINPNIVLFGEPWTAGSTPLIDKTDKTALRQVPVGAFNDDFRNALKGSPDGRDPGFIQNGSNRDALKTALLISRWFASPEQSINYMTCHDNLVLWDKLKASIPGASDQRLVEAMKLGYLILFTSQGVPFFQGGEEFARTKGGNNNSYNAPDAVNEIDWSLKRAHYDLFAYTRDLIALRKAHPVFRLRTREEVANRLKFGETPNEKTLMYTLDAAGLPGETWKHVCIVLNSNDQAEAKITLPAGQWSCALDEHGATTDRAFTSEISVRHRSGMVLFQR